MKETRLFILNWILNLNIDDVCMFVICCMYDEYVSDMITWLEVGNFLGIH